MKPFDSASLPVVDIRRDCGYNALPFSPCFTAANSPLGSINPKGVLNETL
jgi:hypothetical protein